jgi:hypothetical protein
MKERQRKRQERKDTKEKMEGRRVKGEDMQEK